MLVCAERLVEADPHADRSRGCPAAHAVALEWFGSRIDVRFDDPAAAAMFRRRYRAFEADLGPAALCAFAGRDALGAYVFWIDSGPAYRWPHGPLTAEAVAFLADIVVRRAYFSGLAPFASFHAASVRIGSAAAAIVASSEGGKTTTAIACARRGMPLYSDERCIVIDGLVRPFPRALGIRAHALELLCRDDVPGDACIGARLRERGSGAWPCASFDELFGARALPEPARLSALFFIEGRASQAAARPLALDAALPRLLSAPLRSPQSGIDTVACGLSLLRRAEAHALTLGSPDETAGVIERVARAAESPAAC